jgi:hypothetical protein
MPLIFDFDARKLPARWSGLVAALLLCGLMLAGNAHAEVMAPDGCYPVPEVKPLNVSQPLNLDLVK